MIPYLDRNDENPHLLPIRTGNGGVILGSGASPRLILCSVYILHANSTLTPNRYIYRFPLLTCTSLYLFSQVFPRPNLCRVRIGSRKEKESFVTRAAEKRHPAAAPTLAPKKKHDFTFSANFPSRTRPPKTKTIRKNTTERQEISAKI